MLDPVADLLTLRIFSGDFVCLPQLSLDLRDRMCESFGGLNDPEVAGWVVPPQLLSPGTRECPEGKSQKIHQMVNFCLEPMARVESYASDHLREGCGRIIG